MYLLVRQLDSVYRQQLLFRGVNVGSVDKTLMRAEMLNFFMVKHYWAKVLSIGHADVATAKWVLLRYDDLYTVKRAPTLLGSKL